MTKIFYPKKPARAVTPAEINELNRRFRTRDGDANPIVEETPNTAKKGQPDDETLRVLHQIIALFEDVKRSLQSNGVAQSSTSSRGNLAVTDSRQKRDGALSHLNRQKITTPADINRMNREFYNG